ncbi:short-chain dehydrogenase/reductase [Pedobacter sp. KBW06]|uniref:oxidoreductase n=1 Tax=Pedobacter sp. KBW06 TaxID=2153359 RepID=UPI000F5B2DFE|nr:oxidoreductase [Pedobacter sp. KBW06]RQO74214.1 short-chain dehydrogenase/reductase [Pedobacter sp. KBW06]
MDNQKVWFVTGASKGLGLSLVKQLLKDGFKVAATSRKLNELTDAVGLDDPNFLPLALDLNNEERVDAAIATGIDRFGRIDVVVNNAGYGLTGSLEELTDEEARANFDVNVFGSLNVIRKVMPHFRSQHSGHIFNIASIGGYTGSFPGFGIYCATKFAVAGFSESLAAEVKPFGVHVTVVYPGYFRTSFLSSGSLLTPKNEISAYQEVREVQNAHQHNINGNQAGDPEKAVAALINITTAEQPPLHLFLGADAYELAHGKIAQVQQALEEWKTVTVSTGF